MYRKGDENLFGSHLEKLKSYLQNYQIRLIDMVELCSAGLNRYSDLMQNSLNEAKPYYNYSDLVTIHEKNKEEAQTLVFNQMKYVYSIILCIL